MRRSVSFAVFVAVVVSGASALTAPPRNLAVVASQKTESAEVKIDNFSFGPPTLTVSVGTTVAWTNRDDIPHTVTSSDDPKLFKGGSEALSEGLLGTAAPRTADVVL